jgi:hypothetical protein
MAAHADEFFHLPWIPVRLQRAAGAILRRL